MRVRSKSLRIASLAFLLGASQSSFGQSLYSQNFDANDQAGLWSISTGGTTDKRADFFFDYSTVGIPPAPNSTGGSTRGMKLQANVVALEANGNAGVAGGINVSPIGKSFAGDYALRFDLWSNFIGAEAGAGTTPNTEGIWEGGSSSTKFSNYGILSSGVGNNYQTGTRAGVAEALYFTNTGDGQAAFDYRVQGPGTATDHGPSGFRATVETGSTTAANNYDPVLDAGVDFKDVYPAGYADAGKTNRGVFFDPDVVFDPNNPPDDQNISDGFALYQKAFPSVAAPGQAAIYPFTQFGTTMPGAMGMHWREIEIKKQGNIVTWSVLKAGVNSDTDYVLATVDLTLLKVPANSGDNIMFGESDPTANVGTDPDFVALQFTLIDNVRVVSLSAPADADFNNDGTVDGADLLIWQRSAVGPATPATGDATGDGQANAADLLAWSQKFGGPPAVAATGAVPEPTAGLLASTALLAALRRRRD